MEQVQETNKQSKSRFSTKDLAKVAVLSAISFILYMWVKFPLPMLFPSFLDVQISELPALIGGFSMGPVAGCAIIVVKCLLKMPFTSTAYVGELGDLIMGIAFVLPASLIYKKHKNKKGSLIGVLVGAVSFIVIAVFTNWLILIPFYTNAYGWDAVVGMVAALYPGVTQQTFYSFYLFLGVVPFNILRSALVVVLTFLLYKKVSPILHM